MRRYAMLIPLLSLAACAQDYDALLARGERAFLTRDYAAAAAAYKQASEMDPKRSAAFEGLARAHYRLNNMPDAAENYRKAIEAEPESPAARRNLGLVLYRQGDWDGAIRAFSYAIEKEPIEPGLRSNRAMALHKAGRLREAYADIEQALKYAPRSARFWVNKGLILLELDDKAASLEAFKRARALDLNLPEAYAGLGQFYRRYGDEVRAQEFFKVADVLQNPPAG